MQLQRSPYVTNQRIAPDQPVPFSHQHHVAGLGLDCRYCHTTVEESSFAGIPPTKTCMNCHAQIWTNAALLEPVRASFRTGQSLQWTRVHDLPDFVYFNHSIHVNKGIGCSTCHGQVDRMPLMWQEGSLQMEWCLNCHRAPEKFLRPHKVAGSEDDQVFNMAYEQPTSRNKIRIPGVEQEFTEQTNAQGTGLGDYLKKANHVRSVRDITSCNTCHR